MGMVDLVIKNGKVVTPTGTVSAGIAIDKGKIVAISKESFLPPSSKTIDVNGKYTVDTGHIVAFEDTLTYKVKKVGGWKSTLLSGEGLVCEYSGTGRLWIQSRVPGGFIGWVSKLLPR